MFVYLPGSRARPWLYAHGILKAKKIDIPVISVGNINFGGSGKTPFTIYLYNLIQKPACVLKRPYRDETLLYERYNIPVFEGKDRLKFALHSMELGYKAILLDDGFQYLRIQKSFDIVLINARRGLRGFLREHPLNIRRGDLLVITSPTKGFDTSRLKHSLSKLVQDKPIIEAFYKPVSFVDINGNERPLSYFMWEKVLLLSAIADPISFEYTAREVGVRPLFHMKFIDHHEYNLRDVAKLKKKAHLPIITTEKDIVKLERLHPDIDIYALKVKLEVEEQGMLIKKIQFLF
jgi:tetraacyldisaccharide 4'-kinase